MERKIKIKKYRLRRGCQRGICPLISCPDGIIWRIDPNYFLLKSWEGTEEEIHAFYVKIHYNLYLGFYEYMEYHPLTGFRTTDLRLSVSRDGENFMRVENEIPIIERDANPEEWDGGMIWGMAPIVYKEEFRFYYWGTPLFDYGNRMGKWSAESCFSSKKKGALGLATLPLNRLSHIETTSDKILVILCVNL